MSVDRKPDESTLHAYVDGELDRETARDVESWLAANPETRTETETWRRQKAELKARFDPVIEEEIPGDLRRAAARPRRGAWLRPAMQIAAGIVLFALGGLAGWQIAQPGQDARRAEHLVASEALAAHVVFVAEKRHPVEVAAADRAHLVAWLSKRLGRPLSVPDLRERGFALVGGRLLPAGSGAAAQFMYEDRSGRRVTLYVVQNALGGETAFRLQARGDVKSFYWLDGPFGYAITGEVGEGQLLRMARDIYEQLA